VEVIYSIKPWYKAAVLQKRVAEFESYVRTIPDSMRLLEVEKLALETRKHGRPMWAVSSEKAENDDHSLL